MTFPLLPYRRLSASVLSAFLNKLLGKWKKKPKQSYMSFSSSFTARRTPLLVYLLPLTLISLVQKGLNIGTYFR